MNKDKARSILQGKFAALPPMTGPEPNRFTWEARRLKLRRHIADGYDIDSFMRWPTMTEALVIGDTGYVRQEYEELKHFAVWRHAVRAPGVGTPFYLDFAPNADATLINQSYNLYRFLLATRHTNDLTDLHTIVEFGAGFGPMLLIAQRLGFGGTYYIYDFPELQLFQEYWANAAGVTGFDIVWLDQPIHPPADLMIACHSLSEAPRQLRGQWLANLSESYLFTYHDFWDDVDNNVYFAEFKSRHSFHKWSEIDHPYQPGHHMMIGGNR